MKMICKYYIKIPLKVAFPPTSVSDNHIFLFLTQDVRGMCACRAAALSLWNK